MNDHKANGVDKFNGQHIYFGQQQFQYWESTTEYLLPPS